MSYTKGNTPADVQALPAFVDQELGQIQEQWNAPVAAVRLATTHVAPTKPRDGLYMADGTDWDPGDGAGAYSYHDGAFHALETTGSGSSGRTVLSANATYYVATTGNNSNPGTSGSPWLTWQYAYNTIAATLDLNGHNVTIVGGAGTFAETLSMTYLVGGGKIIITGDAGGTVIRSIHASGPFQAQISTMQFDGSNDCIVTSGNVQVTVGGITLNDIGSEVTIFQMTGPSTIETSGEIGVNCAKLNNIIDCEWNSLAIINNHIRFDVNCNITGVGFYLDNAGTVVWNNTKSGAGTVTGKKYQLDNASLFVGSTNAPGSVAGTTAHGSTAN